MALRLRQGTNLLNAAGVLRQHAEHGRSLANSPGGDSTYLAVSRYLNWVDSTEGQLRNFFASGPELVHLRSADHWEIIRADGHVVRRLIGREGTEQASWLDQLAARLDHLHRRLAAATGTIAVLDTNVLLHHERPSEVDWLVILGEKEVRLVIPLRVIEELDEKKWMARDDLAARARGLVSGLWTLLEATPGEPARLRDNVTLEVPIDDDPRHRALDADQEILETCEQVRNVGQPVCLVTGDTGMSIRAVGRGLRVARMPEKYRRRMPELRCFRLRDRDPGSISQHRRVPDRALLGAAVDGR